jgi:hypothetical protein
MAQLYFSTESPQLRESFENFVYQLHISEALANKYLPEPRDQHFQRWPDDSVLKGKYCKTNLNLAFEVWKQARKADRNIGVMELPPGLHPSSCQLVVDFSEALAKKMRNSEIKYGYIDGWAKDDWEVSYSLHLKEHIRKGDPVDVGVYAAFGWYHKWPTNGLTKP